MAKAEAASYAAMGRTLRTSLSLPLAFFPSNALETTIIFTPSPSGAGSQ